MVVRFTWQPKEWREAHLLATMDKNPIAGPVPMGMLLAGMTAVGGAGDVWQGMHRNGGAILHDSMLPMLMLVCALCASVAAVLAWMRRGDSLRDLPAVPTGEQHVVLHERGWSTAAQAEMRGWAEMRGHRTGRHVLTLLACDGRAVSLPLRALTADQGGWLDRLLLRKVPRTS